MTPLEIWLRNRKQNKHVPWHRGQGFKHCKGETCEQTRIRRLAYFKLMRRTLKWRGEYTIEVSKP